MIEAGRVRLNGKRLDTPAITVTEHDKIEVDGKQIGEAEPARLWRYHKPQGLVTTERDEKGRPTVFDRLPMDLPRVMSVGRLDIASEGLLLLTNDGGLKRQLELPSTGWLRRYRVRVHGVVTDRMVEPLLNGITVDGVRYQPMQLQIDSQKGANAWLTVGIREGKNREVRRAMDAVGLTVNRLIRTAYGPFQLGELVAGQVDEIRAKVVREQLGEAAPQTKKPRGRRAGKGRHNDG